MAQKKVKYTITDNIVDENEDDESAKEEAMEKEYDEGWNDEATKSGLLLIGINNADKSARDNQNRTVNEILKEAAIAQEPTKPRYIGAKKAKQAVIKTGERIKMPEITLQGEDASEITEIIMTKLFKRILHMANYDWSFSGPGGVIDGILRYGDKNRIIQPTDSEVTGIPFRFETIDGNNVWVSINATSYRNGNKNVTQLVALFRGTKREFDEKFPQYEDCDALGLIPRTFEYKDLDQTSTQKFATAYAAETIAGKDSENEQVEWMYIFDSSKLHYRLVAGSRLLILEKKDGKKGKDKYPYIFTNIEGKQEPYIPVSNFICLPAEEGIYHVGLVAYLYDMCVVFRRTVNQIIGHVEQNINPETLINIPEGQESTFFSLIETARQMAEQGRTAYIPITYNPNMPAGNVSSANPILNGGDANQGKLLMEIIEDEFRKCGVYLDDPLNSDPTEMQIQQNASNSYVLPKAISKYNAPTIEFELMVALDMCKKYIKDGDKTPIIIDPTLELPDGKYSIKKDSSGQPITFTLGDFKKELEKGVWIPKVNPADGAVLNDNAMIMMYKNILGSMQPQTPQFDAVQDKILALMGVSVKSPNPAQGQLPPGGPGGQPPQSAEGAPPPIPGGEPNAPAITGAIAPNPALQAAAGVMAK